MINCKIINEGNKRHGVKYIPANTININEEMENLVVYKIIWKCCSEW